MENYNRIVLVTGGNKEIGITYEEYVMCMASPERDWNRVEFRLGDKLHRVDGPAIERDDGSKAWIVNGRIHRLDGPAIEYKSGAKAWWVHDKLHRIGGPAVERSNGDVEWWINGKYYRTEQEYLDAVERYKNGEL